MRPDIEKTRAYYRALGPEDICDCAYCRNYCAKVRAAYPEVARYLDSLGVDIEKPFEASPLEPDGKGDLEYCVCQYVVLGTCRRISPTGSETCPLATLAAIPIRKLRRSTLCWTSIPSICPSRKQKAEAYKNEVAGSQS